MAIKSKRAQDKYLEEQLEYWRKEHEIAPASFRSESRRWTRFSESTMRFFAERRRVFFQST